MKYYLAIKMNNTLSFATIRMDLECIMLNKCIREENKDRIINISVYVESEKQKKKKGIRKQNGNRERKEA